MTRENFISKHSIELTGEELYFIHRALFDHICDTKRDGLHGLQRKAEQLRSSISEIIDNLE
jgi:hypothetical protein